MKGEIRGGGANRRVLMIASGLMAVLLTGCGGETAREAKSGAADSPAATYSPVAADTAAADSVFAVPVDTPPGAERGEGTDTAARASGVSRYYVRVRASADPREVAARHGVEPLEVITEPTRAFYAALTDRQRKALEADTLVHSLAREIH